MKEKIEKNKLVLSTFKLDNKTASLFRSYCHLLQVKLDSKWIVNDCGEKSDVIVIDAKEDLFINHNIKSKIILESHTTKVSDLPDMIGNTRVYKINFPMKSSAFVSILNEISSLNENKVKEDKIKKHNWFSKKSLYKFISNINFDKKLNFRKVTTNTPSRTIINKMLNKFQQDNSKQLKVVFLGKPGTGKTTAISTGSTNKVLTTETTATDSVGLLKRQTTIGIDYGEYQVENKVKLRLYGTPGQDRYDFVRNQTIKNTDIYVIMIDLTSLNPIDDFNYFKKLLDYAGDVKAQKVIAFTHSDMSNLDASKLIVGLKQQNKNLLAAFVIDPRNKIEVHKMLKETMRLISNTKLQSITKAKSLSSCY